MRSLISRSIKSTNTIRSIYHSRRLSQKPTSLIPSHVKHFSRRLALMIFVNVFHLSEFIFVLAENQMYAFVHLFLKQCDSSDFYNEDVFKNIIKGIMPQVD